MIISLVDAVSSPVNQAVEFYVFHGIPDLSEYLLRVVTGHRRWANWQFPPTPIVSGSHIVLISGDRPATFKADRHIPHPPSVDPDTGLPHPGVHVFVVPFAITETTSFELYQVDSPDFVDRYALSPESIPPKGHAYRAFNSKPGENRWRITANHPDWEYVPCSKNQHRRPEHSSP